jgi:nucleotide-binding universal stress UspA family protein
MDNSDDAFRGAKTALELVKNQNGTKLPEIIAFHSTEHRNLSEKIALYVPSSFGLNYTIPPTDYRKIKKEYELYGKKILKKVEEIFEKNNIDIKTRLITDEKPEDYIEKVVEENNIDLVVLGSKGEHTKIEQIFSGTIAQKVVNNVPCDVLIVR